VTALLARPALAAVAVEEGDTSDPPDTTITNSKVRHHPGKARFRFHSSESESIFRCKLDDRGYRRCESPRVYRHLDRGRHMFKVKAIDADKLADPTPARRRIRIGASVGPPFPPLKHIEPARMLSGYDCEFISPEVFSPVSNGWRTGNHVRATIVCAGAAGYQGESIGRFLFLRDNFRWGSQKLTKVDIPDAGALRITKAPLGRSVVTSAQRHGKLEFTSENGVSGTLDLRDDSVTLNPEVVRP
jgi:hypothetical protein